VKPAIAAQSARPRGSEIQASALPRAAGVVDGVEWGRQIQNITKLALEGSTRALL